MYNKECALYVFQQHNLINEQYYEIFITKVGVGESINTTVQHHGVMKDTAQEKFKNKFDDLSSDENLEVRKDTG